MKKKNLSKLVALAVLLGGVTYSGSAWADPVPGPVDIIISSTGVDPNTYGGGSDANGIWGVTGAQTVGQDVINSIKTSGDVALTVYGIKVENTDSFKVDSLSGGIDVKSTSGVAYALSLLGTGTTTISGLGNITAETSGELKSAFGIYVRNGNAVGVTPTFSVAFDETNGGNISVYSANVINIGIDFGPDSVGTSEVLNVNKITAGVKSDNSDTIGTGKAHGIYIRAGENKVTFTGSDRSIEAKSSGNYAYGISFGRVDVSSSVAATGTTSITGLESITAEVIGNGQFDARGIYVRNGNDASSAPTFSVTMENGSISAYSAKGNSNGIAFGLRSTGTSEILNVNKITVGEKEGSVSQSTSYGVYAMGGENKVTFTGDDSSITAKSNSGAYGVYVGGGTTTISGLKDISASGSKAYSMYVLGGTLILQPSETKTNGSYMTANAPVSMNGGTLEVDFPAACKSGDTILKITAGTGSTFNDVVICGKASGLQVNDEICLIHDIAAIALDDELIVQHSTDGISWYNADIYVNKTDDKKLMYKKTEKGLEQDGSKAPVEGMAAAAAIVNTSSDLVTGAGMDNMITTTASAGGGAEPFAAGSFGKSRLETGSSVDTKGYGIVVGVGKKVFSKAGNKTTGGLFFEYGNSDFDTYNNAVTGSGKSINKGGGYMMRWDNISGNYYEGMIHAGKITSNWSNSMGGYNMSPTYFGGALTYGHKFMVGEDKQLSVYGSYIYSRIGGGDANIAGYEYSFNATNSHRTKVGVRYAMSDLMDTKKFRPYIGLAWEHEYKGDTVATVRGFGEAPSPSMKGNSGILELGCKQDVGKWTLGIGAELFTGKRRGWNGMLNATYNF